MHSCPKYILTSDFFSSKSFSLSHLPSVLFRKISGLSLEIICVCVRCAYLCAYVIVKISSAMFKSTQCLHPVSDENLLLSFLNGISHIRHESVPIRVPAGIWPVKRMLQEQVLLCILVNIGLSIGNTIWWTYSLYMDNQWPAGLDIIQSHPLHRMCFNTWPLLAVFGWLENGS